MIITVVPYFDMMIIVNSAIAMREKEFLLYRIVSPYVNSSIYLPIDYLCLSQLLLINLFIFMYRIRYRR